MMKIAVHMRVEDAGNDEADDDDALATDDARVATGGPAANVNGTLLQTNRGYRKSLEEVRAFVLPSGASYRGTPMDWQDAQ